MKRIAIALLALPLLFSCGKSAKEEAQRIQDSLNNSNHALSGRLVEKDSTIGSFIHSFNVIQDNLDEIKKKENIINSVSKDGDVKSKEEQIEGRKEGRKETRKVSNKRKEGRKK